ncbi:putative transcriptional regulator [Nocardia nova SH22a]|uniref:Putative transcriptional regulator n=1 Tax=Nocardia nova SH22a TaxID=1415166 RepID=W5TF13_9NOCA|nr:AsnC family transcriptional regulator [Nocardia nova]AHH17749.1 putative transcriptional regulator [Nocardia nova SH22a]
MDTTTTLDELDHRLIHALQLDARAPFSRIADVLGVSDQTVARRYRRLRTSNALRVVAVPDARQPGQVEWLVRIQCAPAAAADMAAGLARRTDVSWVTITSGGAEITCIARTGSQRHSDDLFLQKLSRTPRLVNITAHRLLRYLAGVGGWSGRTSALSADQAATLTPQRPAARPIRPDAADEKLIRALARDARADYRTLVAASGYPESTVRRRIDQLLASGAMHYDVDIDPAALGYEIEALLWLTVSPGRLTEVAAALGTHSEIAFAAATTGPANVVAFLAARDADALFDYLSTDLGALDGLQRVETAPIMRTVKRAGAAFLP